jgi:hypothetical protein
MGFKLALLDGDDAFCCEGENVMSKARVIGAALAIAMLAPAARQVQATGPSATVVFEWNQILQDTVPATHNVVTPRFFAMAHIAMFDAVNAIEREFEPYRVRVRFAFGSADAAAAQAAHDVLVGINPSAAAVYDAALARQLGEHPSLYVRWGAAVGAKVAKDILAWRQTDGWVVSPFPPYSEPPVPGRWQKTSAANAAFPHMQRAVPFALVSATQFLPPPPPTLQNPQYAADLNEVAMIGRSNSATRTAEQTTIARLWAGIAPAGTGTVTNFMSVWNNIVRDVARTRRLSLVETARLFALVNVSVADALQTTQASKFVYGMWRPLTAIQQGDPFSGFTPDVTWTTLIPTPPYPSYAGNNAAIGAAAARALQLAFATNDIAVRATWKHSGGTEETSFDFAGFWQVAEQEAESRIYGGIHFRFDNVAGLQIGKSTAEFIFANYMARRDRWDD